MAEQKVGDEPKVPPPPPRQPDGSLKGYIERGNTSRPVVTKNPTRPADRSGRRRPGSRESIVTRLLNFLRHRFRSLTQPVLPPHEQRRFDAERSSDGTGHGGVGPR